MERTRDDGSNRFHGGPFAMSRKRELPVARVCGGDIAVRRRIGAAIASLGDVELVGLDEIGETETSSDLTTLCVVLDAAGVDEDTAGRLSQIPAWSRGVLVTTESVPADVLDETLARLQPLHVIRADAPEVVIRHIVCQQLDGGVMAARDQHRPARAILGVSAVVRELLDQVRQVANSRVPVLITGETGTGKELVARSVHEQSPRACADFVAINCGALPDNLLEAELFGYEPGGFTGAERSKQGLFEEASGGTLFLDEIGDTSPALQVKLLRAIEEGEIRRLGDGESRSVDVRIVSATHRDLAAAVEDGSFRQDLLYRLNTVTLSVPPLRRRRVDIPFLAQHFAEEFGAADARRITLSDDFVEGLTQLDFPGNVRELRNAVERAITLATPGESVSANLLPEGARRSGVQTFAGTLKERVEELELRTIQEALAEHDGNRTRAAEKLGLSRVGLRNKMRRFGLE